MFDKKEVITNNKTAKKSNAQLWKSVSEDKQVNIKGGKSSDFNDSIAMASVWPPRYYPFC